MTKKDKFEVLKNMVMASDIENVEYGDEFINKDALVEFIDREIELVSRKSSKSTPTKTQKENVAVKDTIVDALATVGKPVTVSELQAADERMGALSNQKISALLRNLIKEGRVVKTSDKKKSYFAVAC